MKTRIALASLGLLLAFAPAAQAATNTTYNAGTKDLTITNDGEGETFAVSITYQDSAPTGFVYRVDGGVHAIPLGGSTCTNEGGDGTKILCEPDDDVDKIILNAGAGNDVVTISDIQNYYSSGNPGLEVNGDGDDDTFTAGVGGALQAGQVNGGPGNDTFNGSALFRDTFQAEAGDDTYRGGTKPIPPGQDPDGFQRYSAADDWRPSGDTPISISLDGVANDVDGQGGTDNVSEIETIEATPGNDTLIAGPDGVRFYGVDGDDTLTGSPQVDLLSGGEGNDTLRGLAGDDSLSDGDFDEVSRSSGDTPNPVGNDTLEGGDGDDTLSVAGGKDDVAGGAGTDSFATTRYATQVFESVIPTDLTPQLAPVTVSLNDQPDDGVTDSGEGDNIRADVENVSTGGGSGMVWAITRGFSNPPLGAPDTITGSAAANVITTGGGNDKLDGLAGADQLNAGAGDDMVNAVDQGTDTILCGRGTDSAGADLPGTNPGRADVLNDCETVTGTPLSLEGGALPTAPTVTVGGSSKVKVKRFLRNYTLATDVTTDQAATATGVLSIAGAKVAKAGDLELGTGKLASGTGKRALKVKVAVKFRKAIKRKLRTKKQRRRGIKLKLAVTVTNAAGQSARKNRTIRVKG